jgi:16S rRNA (cytosine967-C5)-methyltransferase
MTPGGRLSAAIEVIDDLSKRSRPASEALSDWGKSHRFAGSGDRAAIGNLVYDALRRRSSIAHRMQGDSPRDLILGVYALHWESLEALQLVANGEGHAPAGLSESEVLALSKPAAPAPAPVAGDYPAFLDNALERVYGEDRAKEMAGYANRAPIDLRVNTLKSSRATMLAELNGLGAIPGTIAATSVRIPVHGGQRRAPNVEAEPAYRKGQIELQDEGSQVASLLVDARPGHQVADLCAGGGGKTLALAACLENKGQIFAWDSDKHRLKGIFERLERAGVRNVQVLRAGVTSELEALRGKMDRVVLDVPCTGTGAWRRRPDAKWRLRPQALDQRVNEQIAILRAGAELVRPGGRLVYVTCSVLAEENEDRMLAFLSSQEGRAFQLHDLSADWRRMFAGEAPQKPSGVSSLPGVRLSPRQTGTDGFYVCALERSH